MQLSGKLDSHLRQIDRQAREMVDSLTQQMAAQQGVTQALKAADQMKWTGLMNSIRAAAEEAVLTDLIFS